MKRLLTVILTLGLVLEITAQENSRNTYLQFGVAAVSYHGDLGEPYKKWTSSFHLGLQFNKKGRITGAFQLNYGNFQGQASPDQYDDPDITPNTFVSTRFFSANYDVQINAVRSKYWKVYASLGLGMIIYTPKNEDGEGLIDIVASRSEGEDYAAFSVMFPLKIGVIHYLPNRFGVGLEAGYYNTLTDYLDNISNWGTNDGNDNLLSLRFSVYYKIKP